ncbi:hypothetical protein [Plebeiibacterium sediminum]|uniref:Sensor of ECF-type sigma factor n=1 Tax=Plebeiibacterium sediminum TaxID=2992112 RepID=A0AAE3SHX2_9BACT|nr:hypothetical protein [Plebeiobacterium sediminum]MCW3788568.1 hypothetical protein [Plebeiobacterium sediminum]
MNRIIFFILFITISISAIGQQFTKEEKIERLKAQKIAFITDKLDLSTKEAQSFWPIYNEFFRKKEMLSIEKKKLTLELRQNWEQYSDDRKTELTDSLILFRLKEAKLEQNYHEKFKQVLSIDKVIQLYNAETQFKNYLLKQIRSQNTINNSDRPAKRK